LTYVVETAREIPLAASRVYKTAWRLFLLFFNSGFYFAKNIYLSYFSLFIPPQKTRKIFQNILE